MALCTIKIHYPNSENWNVGDVVDISNPTRLIEEGKVELFVDSTIAIVEPTSKVVIQPKKTGRKKIN